MNNWDAPDNSNPKENLYQKCNVCGAYEHCVSSEGYDEDSDRRKVVCNHCYDEDKQENNCKQAVEEDNPKCIGCKHLDKMRYAINPF